VRKMNPGSFIIGYSMEPKEIAFLNAGADKFIIKDHLMKELIQSLKDRNHHISGRKKFTV
jgi:DNA-binding response OmpR family regulator